MSNITKFADDIMRLRYSWDGKESWDDIAQRVATNVSSALPAGHRFTKDFYDVISKRKFIPGGRFLAQAGRDYHQTNNCYTLRAEDTREGWGDLMQKSSIALMSGGGIGIDYSALRSSGTPLRRSGGTASGPLPLMRTINEIGRGVMSGGKRRSAIWAGLHWNHQDVFEFLVAKNWSEFIHKGKEKDFDFPAPMDMTNVSVILDTEFFNAYENRNHENHARAQEIYWTCIHQMITTGEPGFSINYVNPNESLRNACAEIVSEDDSDVCCLGSINLDNIESLDELASVAEIGTIFLLAGTEYSDVPYEKVRAVREKNRRIGLGLMGMASFLARRGIPYGPNDELEDWLRVWQQTSDRAAKNWADVFGMNRPIAKRAIAPNGTISIAGGLTTSGIEPIFAVAYKRQYLSPSGWKYQYVIDPVAERLVEQGISPDKIEDAYTLSLDVERRIQFQAFVQKYVDNAISSTINLPAVGTPGNNNHRLFGDTLYKYLPSLRGITVYPDGARSGQPLSPVDFNYAMKHKDVIFEAHEECSGSGVCGL